jgi:UDP-galactopyranose mutase
VATIDVLVVGAGFAGCVMAERAAAAGRQVLVIDQRSELGGNAADGHDAAGVLVHRYGPHIFHANAPHVVAYLSRFTAWRPYEHRILAEVEGRLYPIPINRTTINALYGLELDEAGVAAYLERVREPRAAIRSSEDVVLAAMGRDLCEKFFRNYTRKQWGLDLSELSPSVAGRIPIRTNDDDRCFTDSFQAMPAAGFTAMFRRMLTHPRIQVELGAGYREVKERVQAGLVVYTGAIDGYFEQCYGPLTYRSLRFEHQHLPGVERFQPVGTVNYPNQHGYTRITEFKHLTGQQHSGSSIVREYPQAEGVPCYPVPTAANQQQYELYRRRAEAERGVIFLGRLAEYRYYNMDQVTAAALAAAARLFPEVAAAENA